MATIFLNKSDIPYYVLDSLSVLEQAGYHAHLVGGCVRDIFLKRTPKDWDITTNATPEQIIPLFPKTVYENTFGTVTVVYKEETVSYETQITTYRTEHGYTDNRHPDEVTFVTKLEDDLARRDFTINAMALSLSVTEKGIEASLTDPYGGIKDIDKGYIRAVGTPEDRFKEDALRMLRAIRFACELSFEIEEKTLKAIKTLSNSISNVSRERIRDEFIKVLMSTKPYFGISVLRETGLLSDFLPELASAYGVTQNQAHAFDVFEHLGRSVQHAADKNMPLSTRLAALFHDIAKPQTKAFSKEKGEPTFYGHEVVGSRETKKIMERLRFPQDITKKVQNLVRWHMFFSDTEQITPSAVRRLISNVGKENIQELLDVRVCDRIGTGRPKENPYRLRKYRSMIDEVLRDPISLNMLAIDGNDLINTLHMKPGPMFMYTLNALMELVLENPKLNTKEILIEEAKKLQTIPLEELKGRGEAGKEKLRKADEAIVQKIRNQHHVS